MDSNKASEPQGNTPRAKRRKSRRSKPDVALITDAQESPGQSRHRREIVYGLLQFIRVPSLLLAFYLIYAHQAWVWAALVVAVTLPLPWVAVVQANDHGRKREKRERNVYKPALARQMQAQYEAQLAAQHYAQLEQSSEPEAPEVIDHEAEDDEPPRG